MSVITLDTKELRESWMKWYLNVNLLQSNHPKACKILEEFKMPLCEFNEKVMQFFDALEEKVKA
ncbi:hypothetical protein ES702_01827 [subsurface metagenome]